MKKEIVICAFSEITSWLPIHWRPCTIVYVCGNQTNKIEKLNSKHNSFRGHQHNFTGGPSFNEQLENLEKLLNLVARSQQVFLNKSIENEEIPPPEATAPYAKAVTSNCPNLRESEQWLNHIIWRYDVLAETTFFLQGNPFDHSPDIINIVDQTGAVNFTTLPYSSAGPASSGADPDLILPIYNSLFNTQHTSENAPFIRWAAGAQFAASSEIIRSKSKEYYVSLQEKMRGIPKSGEIMERIWWNVLGCPQ
jgi:hypothetical protein